MSESQAPLTRLFREEGKTGAIECPGCGAPITLRSFGAIEQVACTYCGTICKPEENGALAILQQAERKRVTSKIPLHHRGVLDGITWEIIGITWRQIVGFGSFSWQEFLLFNPYEGYRWLIFSHSDQVWSYGGALPGAPDVIQGSHPIALYRGQTYKHFTSGTARTTYVEGEFPWQVLAGDTVATNDYVCPPNLISIEVQQTEHGADVNFTQMREIQATEVWAAFKLPGAPTQSSGIHPAALNPHADAFYWIAPLALFVVWLIATVVYSAGRDHELVFRAELKNGEVLTAPLEIGSGDGATALEFELSAIGMLNSWAYADIILVENQTEEAIALGLEVDYYAGVDSGESWSEGTNPNNQTVGGVAHGSYTLQVSPQIDPSGDPADSLVLQITRDVPLHRYVFLPLFVIIAFPAINMARRANFERKRWADSDHAPVASETDSSDWSD